MSEQSSGRVHGHGALLALAEHDLAIVLASENVADIIGVELDRVLGAGIASILVEPAEHELRDLLGGGELACTNPIEARTHDGRCLDAVLHRASGMLVIELEPAANRVRSGRINRAIDRLQSASDLAHAAIDEIKDIVGMANIALYRRGGELVAASGRAPASVALDAGELVRFVADRSAAPVALVPSVPLAPHALELSGSVLRATSDAGTGALLAIAASDWGVVVCEHPEPRHVEYTARAAAQVIAGVVGLCLRPGEPEEPRIEREGAGVLAGAKILIVDDDVDSGEMLALLLQTAGAQAELATTAAAGMAAIHGFHPDVVVSDITLPDKDGFTFMREVRSLGPDEGGWIPAIAVSGHVDAEAAHQAILAGFQLHIPKPIDPPDLIARLARLVGRTARRT